MSLAGRITTLSTRIATEIKAVRTELAAAGGATVKVSALTALAPSALAFEDEFPVVDKSDTTQAASGSTKKTTNAQIFRKLASQYTNATTTSTDLTNLSFPVIAGRTYHFKFTGLFQVTATTTRISLNATGPAMTKGWWRSRLQQAASGTDSYYEGTVTVSAAATPTTKTTNASNVALGTDYAFEFEGDITPSANGTFQLQASAGAAGTLTIQAGANGIITDLG